jgi:hypothetical protein
MQLSELSYHHLYRAEEERMSRELERRRIARERIAEERAGRLARKRAKALSDASGTMGVCVHAAPARH